MATLDRGSRIYLLVLAAIAAALVGLWLSGRDSRVEALNETLQRDSKIAAYPFPFRVLRIEGRTAVVNSPRSPQVSVLRFLAVVRPDLAGLDPDDAAVVAAQKRLAGVQSRVRKRILEAPYVDQVRWQLDRDWFSRHGIVLPQG
ncbi:MAG TPA: hypothetical protein ENK05_02140 [Gammaproteobacteria bacterium]|nr:hypothetical protein [Gammaproteobacteria bacterium]